ncbi:MAG: sterol desaturase family protein [Planctomycetota bacterium]
MPKTLRSDGFLDYSGWWWQLARPWVILPTHGALILLTGGSAWRRSLSATMFCFAFCSGYASWTLFEYVLHRWFLHHHRIKAIQAVFWTRLHREHHQYRSMRDPDHHGVHVGVSLPLALLVILAASTEDSGVALALVAGWLFGYLAYEALHWLFHSAERDCWIGRLVPIRALWDAHRIHHLVTMKANYGFVALFWDRRFRTYRAR